MNPNSKTVKTSPQFYAKTAGVLFLISILAGGFGEFFVLNKLIVSGDATATAINIHASTSLFRLGFASYLAEAVCDVSLTVILYLLLRPVRKDIALLAAFFGLVSTVTFAFAELFYFAVLLILDADYLKTFSPNQVNSLVLLSLKLYGYGGGIFMVFYGVASILRGYLIFQSGYLPKFLGILLVLAGAGFVIRNFLLVLAPDYASDFLLLPTPLAILALALWLLVKGVNVTKWNKQVSMESGREASTEI